MADDKGKARRLLLIAGMAPKGAPDDEPDGDEEPEAETDEDAPSEDAVDAAHEAMAALKSGDADAFARAVMRIKAEA